MNVKTELIGIFNYSKSVASYKSFHMHLMQFQKVKNKRRNEASTIASTKEVMLVKAHVCYEKIINWVLMKHGGEDGEQVKEDYFIVGCKCR